MSLWCVSMMLLSSGEMSCQSLNPTYLCVGCMKSMTVTTKIKYYYNTTIPWNLQDNWNTPFGFSCLIYLWIFIQGDLKQHFSDHKIIYTTPPSFMNHLHRHRRGLTKPNLCLSFLNSFSVQMFTLKTSNHIKTAVICLL